MSKTQIAFAYANNIWVVDKSGGMARRLTSFQGTTENPKFSPDGKLIAFSAQYGGNVDVYVVPAEGGEPKRLTWHPGADVVEGWTPDGKSIVFNSSRATSAPSAAPRFWTVPVEGGVETPMALPRAYQGKISPDGRRVAYRMNNSWDEERRNYRGGQNRPIWIVDLKTFALDTTPNVTSDLVVAQAGSPRGSSHFSAPSAPESKNMDPVWVNDDVIDFVSDRDGVANVWTYDTKSKKLTQATHFTNFDVKAVDAASDGSAVVFEQAGDIHLLDPKTRQRARGEHHRRGRLRVDDAAVEGRVGEHEQPGAVADGQAHRRRGARRDLHDSRRARRRPQSHELERVGGARAGVVARRQAAVVLQRQVGRVRALHRVAGRAHAAARDQDSDDGPLLHGGVVARRQANHVPRHEPAPLGRGRRDGPGEDGRQRSVDGADAHDESGVVAGRQVDRVLEASELALHTRSKS